MCAFERYTCSARTIYQIDTTQKKKIKRGMNCRNKFAFIRSFEVKTTKRVYEFNSKFKGS